jgi:hypothetical protein
MRAIPIIILTFLLMACSGGIGGAPGGGPGGDTTVGGPIGGDNSSAAQPLDPGFSEHGKDINAHNYVLRDAKGRAVCKEANGDFRVKFSGQVFNDRTQMGVAGYLRISDINASKFQVTRAALDPEIGNFSTVMKVKAPFDITFAMLITNDEFAPLDVLLPFGGGIVQVIVAEPTAPLSIEENDLPCVEAASDHGNDYRAAPDYELQLAD